MSLGLYREVITDGVCKLSFRMGPGKLICTSSLKYSAFYKLPVHKVKIRRMLGLP